METGQVNARGFALEKNGGNINLRGTGEEIQHCSYMTATSPANCYRPPRFLEAHLQVCNVGAGTDAHAAGAGAGAHGAHVADIAAGAADNRAVGGTPPVVLWAADPALQTKSRLQANIYSLLEHTTLMLSLELEVQRQVADFGLRRKMS